MARGRSGSSAALPPHPLFSSMAAGGKFGALRRHGCAGTAAAARRRGTRRRPATSRWWSHVTYFFVNGFDDLLVSVEVALVQGVTVDKVK